ncbi:MAG: DUF1598 domain-containing protein [Pirellulaceae bacterium]|nr:DUF1598 domain-containing protein [Pirellulaceae bacterium]
MLRTVRGFATLAFFIAICLPLPLFAQGGNTGQDTGDTTDTTTTNTTFVLDRNTIGGISIDVHGVLGKTTTARQKALKRLLTKSLAPIDGNLDQLTPVRKVSLKRLEALLADAVAKNQPIPDEVKYLAGLQRIQYIFVYPEENDIVLAGPGEGWEINKQGIVVGKTTKMPVLLLDDLLVALRTSEAARTVGISCSIDPSEEGRRNMRDYLAQQQTFHRGILQGIEEQLGPQKITLTGVDTNSHLARVLVAADYRMKSIAMKLERSPVKGLKSYLEMISSSSGNIMPRWWLASNYEPIAKTEDGLAWEIRGLGVKALTEDEFITADGQVQGTGQANPVAQKWADTMTSKYEELSKKEAVFGQLRNVMDMCLVAALIDREGLLQQSKCSLTTMQNRRNNLVETGWASPKTVPTQSSFMKKGRNYIITASGGVQIESWEAASNQQVDAKVKESKKDAGYQKAEKEWWWN